MKKLLSLLSLSLLLFFTVACDDDDENPDPTKGEIAIATSLPNQDGQTGSSYLQTIDEFTSQTLDNSLAYQIPYSSPCIMFDNDIFVMPGTSSDILSKYTRNENQELVENGQILLPNGSWAFTMLKASDEKAYVSLLAAGKIWVINPATMTKITEINLSSYGVGDVNPDPAAMCIRDGKLYIGLYQAVGGPFPDPSRPYTDVLIINTTTNAVEKKISTESLPGLSSTGLSSPTRPIDNNTIFVDENNDVYVVCLGALGVIPGHKSGILRINSNETDFDESYKFVISDSTVIDETNQISHILTAKYMGNGKLYANANFPAYADPVEPSQFFDRTAWPVVIDIYSKTITKLPFTKRSTQFASVTKYKNNVIYGMITESDQGFYSYDTLTGEASSKPVITTTGNPLYFGYFGDN